MKKTVGSIGAVILIFSLLSGTLSVVFSSPDGKDFPTLWSIGSLCGMLLGLVLVIIWSLESKTKTTNDSLPTNPLLPIKVGKEESEGKQQKNAGFLTRLVRWKYPIGLMIWTLIPVSLAALIITGWILAPSIFGSKISRRDYLDICVLWVMVAVVSFPPLLGVWMKRRERRLNNPLPINPPSPTSREEDEKKFVQADESKFPTWKTVTLGVLGDRVMEMIHSLNHQFSRIMPSPFIKGRMNPIGAPELRYLDLVKVSAEDFGLGRCSWMKDLYQKAEEAGLELCSAEVAPQVATQFELHQSDRGILMFAMQPVYDSISIRERFIFVIRTEGGVQNASGVYFKEDSIIGDREWIFVKPRRINTV